MKGHHFLLLSLPAQSHINPTIQLAKNLARSGARVTFATTTAGKGRINSLPTVDGLYYTTFSDGNDNGTALISDSIETYLAELRREGSKSIPSLLDHLSLESFPVTFMVYTFLLPWVAEVARDMHIPSAFLFIQSASCFAIYHRFFNSRDGLYDGEHDINPNEVSIKFPGLPLLTGKDMPTYLFQANMSNSSMISIFREHIQTLEKDTNPCVLVNTFVALEEDLIKGTFGHVNFIPIGPLVPSAFSEKCYGGDLLESSRDNYVNWLDSKPDKSVIYVAFGSFVVIKQRQKEELLQGLLESGRPFLWVIRDIDGEELKSMKENGLSEEGLIVPWCSQVEVLCHRSTGCFVTHCGWNSTVESLIGEVPLVGCPQFADQLTNVKMVDEVWGNGVRPVVENEEEGVFGKEEIKRCLEVVMGDGEKGKEIRRNALKWRSLAMEAVKEGGSSYNNLKLFLERYVTGQIQFNKEDRIR